MTTATGTTFGITITGKPEEDLSPSQQVAETLDLTHAARDNGLDSIVVGQHFLSNPYRYFQPVPTLARLIPESGDMQLVTGILLLPLLPPVDVAEQLATIDVMSDGRLTMGVGLGYRDAEFIGLGIPREQRVDRQMEALDVITALWSGGAVSHSGTYYDVDDAAASVVPLQQPRPPIWVAANAEPAIARAASHGYLPYVGPRADRGSVAEWVAQAREHDPGIRLPIRRDLLVFDDDRQIAEALGYLRKRYEVYRGWGREADGSGRSAGSEIDELKKSVLIGHPEEVVEEILRYDEIGVSTIVFRVIWPGLEHRRSLQMIESIGERVIPAVRAASPFSGDLG